MMHNKNKCRLAPINGFLLIEFIISFSLLSFAVLLLAQSFFSSMSQYHQAKMRMQALHKAQNKIELIWTGQSSTIETGDGYTLEIKEVPIEQSHMLPNRSNMYQQSVEVSWKCKGDNKVCLFGSVKER
jgi:type II secretory pathway pseudopilin PulG